jgi:mono/diheme cytochrome c family protein/glucose/arabinose dehydrogenase
MKTKLIALGILALSVFIVTCKVKKIAAEKPKPFEQPAVINNPSPDYLSPQESLKSFHMPDGYHLQLVASEPMIQEPVAIAWDGNGRMFVAELNTYMQDIKGSTQHQPICKVMLLEDTNGDGVMDKSSVFIDSLVLPRMIMCIGHELFVSQTFSNSIWAYKDTNGDGKADTKRLAYRDDRPDTRNLEHQNSGLMWNLDNWIYIARDSKRFKYDHGMLLADSSLTTAPGQWGLTSDNFGRIYYSNAGGEIPAEAFQINVAYGRLEFNDQYNPEFQAVWPIIATPDVQGGMKRLRPDTTLNHFTASNGQSIVRGDKEPQDLQGDLLICEPVGRLIRRAKVTDEKGKIYLKNAYDRQEFIASTDMNFRPVNTATGPDGCVYIVDMNRGIIQEQEFINSFLRPRILKLGLEKHIGHGRIYRLVHDGFKPGAKPDLLNEPSSTLVTYLNHPNGWWRDNAQKELIVRGDQSVVPALKEIAGGEQSTLKGKPDNIAQIHALWTLEGLNAIDKTVLFRAFKDPDAQVRKTAVWISERYIKKDDAEVLDKLDELKADPSYDVRVLLMLSLNYGKSEKAKAMSQDILTKNADNEMITGVAKSLETARNTKLYGRTLALMPPTERGLVLNGAVIFRQLCSTCHGPDGKGLSIGGTGMAAPPFVGSQRVAGDKEVVIKVLLHGLTGPVDGKTYDVMTPFGASNSDEWVASVLSYVRQNFGAPAKGWKDLSSIVYPEDVKKLRAETAKKQGPYTLSEIFK